MASSLTTTVVQRPPARGLGRRVGRSLVASITPLSVPNPVICAAPSAAVIPSRQTVSPAFCRRVSQRADASLQSVGGHVSGVSGGARLDGSVLSLPRAQTRTNGLAKSPHRQSSLRPIDCSHLRSFSGASTPSDGSAVLNDHGGAAAGRPRRRSAFRRQSSPSSSGRRRRQGRVAEGDSSKSTDDVSVDVTRDDLHHLASEFGPEAASALSSSSSPRQLLPNAEDKELERQLNAAVNSAKSSEQSQTGLALAEPELTELTVPSREHLPKSLPEPPKEFEWVWIEPLRTAVLRPLGWRARHGVGKVLGMNTYKCAISLDDAAQFKVGLSITAYSDIYSQPLIKHDTPLQLAEFFTSMNMQRAGPPGPVKDDGPSPELIDSWQYSPMDGLDTYGLEYIMQHRYAKAFPPTFTRDDTARER